MKYIHPLRWLNKCKDFANSLQYWVIPDKVFLGWEYKRRHGKTMHLDPPVTINEKMQWIKLYDRKPIYHKMIDKIAAKEYIAEKVGDEYNIPLLGTWSRFEDIDFDQLPRSFVLKCNHDNSSWILVHDKSQLDKEKAKDKLNEALHHDFYHCGYKEWGYKGIKPMIMAEEFLQEDKLECQVFCNNGQPVLFLVRSDLGDAKDGFAVCYSTDWKKLDYRVKKYPDVNLPKPVNYEKMLDLAHKLAKDTLHVRVDFYEMSDGRLFVGEMTFYSHGGDFSNFTEEGCKFFTDTLKLPLNSLK